MNLIDVAGGPADAAKVNANFAEVAAAIAALPTVPTEIVDARKFGVVPDGSTDCTDEFIAAYEAACVSQGTLLIPAGTVVISGVDLGGAMYRSCSIEGLGYDGRGNGFGPASRIKLANGANRSLFRLLPGDGPHQMFRKLILEGNDANQTVSAPLVLADDDLSTNTYPVGLHMEHVHLIRGKGGGLQLGKRRGSNYLANVVTYMCGSGNSGHGISIDTFDVTMVNCHLGNSYGYGLNLISGSQLELTSVNSYLNQLGGVYVGAGVTDMVYTNGSIDRNMRFGVNSAKRTDTTYVGGRAFIGTRFLGNCSGFDGSFPDVMIAAGDTDFRFVGSMFMGKEGTYGPGHAIYFGDSAASAQLAACKFNAASSWRWAISNYPSSLILDNRIS
jgi:hypothetical protein